jgi:hypothetical protein
MGAGGPHGGIILLRKRRGVDCFSILILGLKKYERRKYGIGRDDYEPE